jgi:hypothetical protein
MRGDDPANSVAIRISTTHADSTIREIRPRETRRTKRVASGKTAITKPEINDRKSPVTIEPASCRRLAAKRTQDAVCRRRNRNAENTAAPSHNGADDQTRKVNYRDMVDCAFSRTHQSPVSV